MSEQVTVYGTGDLRPALESIGATQRQLSYLVTKDYIKPSVRMAGRVGYTSEDLVSVFLMLGPLRALDPEVRRMVASVVAHNHLSGFSVGEDEFIEVDLDDSKQDRCPAVKIRIDRQELKADFASFLGRIAGVSQEWVDAVARTPEGVADLTGKEA